MRSWIIAFALLIALVVAYALYAIHAGGGGPTAPKTDAESPSTLVSVKDVYSSGTHAISGTILVPDACIVPVAGAATSTDGIRVDVNTATDDGVCLRIPTKQTFTTSVSGSADAVVSVYLNNAFATTTKGVAPPAKPAVTKKK